MRIQLIFVCLINVFSVLQISAKNFSSEHSDNRVMIFTLKEAIEWAQANSPDALSAVHTYRAAYWNYRSFKANYLPYVSFTSSPNLNRQINKITQPDGTEIFIRQNQLSTDIGLQISQNVSLTGGNFFIQTSSRRIDELGHGVRSYNTQPFSVGYSQSLFGYNNLKWDKLIEPIRFREAQKSFNESLELIASKTCMLFYALASAQTNKNISFSNFASADTLYRYACGRYTIGNITENEMLQLEVNRLTEETNLMNADIELENAMLSLRSYLGIKDGVEIVVNPYDSIYRFEIPVNEALKHAYRNSPDIELFQCRKIESRSQLASAKASRGLKADMYLQFGLSQTSENFKESYIKPLDQQYISISLSFPVLDWGRGKGKVRVAKSQMQLVETQISQEMINFELNVRKMVRQFNLQYKHLEVAEKIERTASKRYEIALRMYLSGKSSFLDMNIAMTERDSARRNYISALQTYWSLYYGIRSMTQYDFINRCPLNHNLPEE